MSMYNANFYSRVKEVMMERKKYIKITCRQETDFDKDIKKKPAHF